MTKKLPKSNDIFPFDAIKLLKPSERLLTTWLFKKSYSMYSLRGTGKLFDPEKVREPLSLFRGVWEELSNNHPEYKKLCLILDHANKFNDDLVYYDELLETEEKPLPHQSGQTVPLTRRIAGNFVHAILPLCKQFDEMNDAAYVLACEIFNLEVDDPTAALIKHGQLPGSFKKVIQASTSFDTRSFHFSKEFGEWMKQQMVIWAERWEKSFENTGAKSIRDAFNKWPRFSQEVFSKVYSLLVTENDIQSPPQETRDREPTKDHDLENLSTNHIINQIPAEYRSPPMSMKDAAARIGGNMTAKKLRGIIENNPNYRITVSKKSFIFDTRIPPFERLKER